VIHRLEVHWGWLVLPWSLACGGGDPPSQPAPMDPTPLPPLAAVTLTDVERLVPVHEVIAAQLDLDPRDPEAMATLLTDGFGEVEAGPAESLIDVTLDDLPPPAPGPNPRMLTRFVHLADSQLIDDESPARFASLDIPEAAGPFRAQEAYQCRILNAAVRSINALHRERAIDVVLLGGDNVDNAQQNEHAWLLQVLSGSDRVECDSGEDNDPEPGTDNDPKDAFVAEGLDVPWLWVMGNHDVLTQGLREVSAYQEVYLGSDSPTGTRDWSQPGGPVVKSSVAPDAMRSPLSAAAILGAVAADGDGHGIDDAALARGKASYLYDLGDDVRFVVMDMAWPDGGTEGVITQSDLDDFVRPAIESAGNRWVILASHHSSNTLATADDIGAQNIPSDQLTTEQWRDFVASYDNVLVHLTGHSHLHRVHRREATAGDRYWEVITSALSDYPHQMRVIELWDEDNGFVTMRSVALDYATDDDPVAADGRAHGIADFTAGWAEDAAGVADDRNVRLWVPAGSM
jgi:Calcineurin-like phosphoesterase